MEERGCLCWRYVVRFEVFLSIEWRREVGWFCFRDRLRSECRCTECGSNYCDRGLVCCVIGHGSLIVK